MNTTRYEVTISTKEGVVTSRFLLGFRMAMRFADYKAHAGFSVHIKLSTKTGLV